MVLTVLTALSFATASLRWKPMNFDNPGSKRLLKATPGSYFFYRSLPEKSMLINVKNSSTIEIRAFSNIKLEKPVFYLKYADQKATYDLKLLSVNAQYQVYEPVRITLPPGVKQLELLCYNRNTYFRAFEPIQIQKKKPPTPSLLISSFLAKTPLLNNAQQSVYYSFDATKPLTFQVKKGKVCHLYYRGQITDKSIPAFSIHKDGVLLGNYKVSAKRTNTYKVEGFKHLSTGKILELPATDKTVSYELRATTKHVLIAKPVIKK